MQIDQTCTAFLVTYLSVDDVAERLLLHQDDIDSYAYIIHDRDIDSDGVLKSVHIHLFIKCFSAHKLGVYRKWFSSSDSNCLAKSVYSPSGCLAYLTHRNNPDKFQYSDDDVVSFNCDSLFNVPFVDSKINYAMSMIDDIIKGVSVRDMVSRYGMNYVVNRNSLESTANVIICDERSNSFKSLTKGCTPIYDDSLPFT